MFRGLAALAFVGAIAVAAPVSAATTVALYSGSGAVLSNNRIRIDNGDVKLQVTAWNSTSSNLASDSARSRGTLAQWEYGLGATYNGDTNHTIDNTGRYDFLLLQFDKAVALNTVTFTSGWDDRYDSDATISHANVNYASYGGTYRTTSGSFWTAADGQLNANKTAADTPNNSFNYGYVNASRRQVNPTLVTSNVWLIAARIGDLDSYKDGFKVKGFTYTDPYDFNNNGVPEPGTWALLIVGFGAIGGAMRRKVRASIALA